MEHNYSEIRYYGEEDLKEVVDRLLKEPTIYRIGRYVMGNVTDEQIREKLRSYDNVKDFQVHFILQVIKKIIEDTVDHISSEGVDKFSRSPNDKYMFITNHRNIVLDASFLNHELHMAYGNDFESTAIAIGNNLLNIPWVKDLARLNKSFVVIRDSGVQQMLENSRNLSSYIRRLIKERISSVWIAQKEGRAKDGNDFTQPGLLKMFQMQGSNDFVKDFAELHMVPVAISYEYDPCISQKVKEQAIIENDGVYVKTPIDDFNSMYNGLMGYKGRVHLSFGDEITEDVLAKMNGNIPKNEKIKLLADYIDKFIHSHYKLWPNGFIAADLLNNKCQFEDKYTQEMKEKFLKYMDDKLNEIEGDRKQFERIFLTIHANPIKNSYKYHDKFVFDF